MDKFNGKMNALSTSLNECTLANRQDVLPGSGTPHQNTDPKCILCNKPFRESYYVQCPTLLLHKFCFSCTAYKIIQQGAEADVFCPSGQKCLQGNSGVPWKFSHTESADIVRKLELDQILISQSLRRFSGY